MIDAYKVRCWSDPGKARIATHRDGHERLFVTWEEADSYADGLLELGLSATVIGPLLESSSISERRALRSHRTKK